MRRICLQKTSRKRTTRSAWKHRHRDWRVVLSTPPLLLSHAARACPRAQRSEERGVAIRKILEKISTEISHRRRSTSSVALRLLADISLFSRLGAQEHRELPAF